MRVGERGVVASLMLLLSKMDSRLNTLLRQIGIRMHNVHKRKRGEGQGGRIHDVEVNYFTCGFPCHFTCKNSLLVAHVKT